VFIPLSIKRPSRGLYGLISHIMPPETSRPPPAAGTGGKQDPRPATWASRGIVANSRNSR
jgi:hypothetical protein